MRHAKRRFLLAGVAVLLGAAAPEKPPIARVDNVTDVYFGKKLSDPYRWMETPSAELDSWAHAQDAYTRAVLADIPGRDALRTHMDQVAGQLTVVTLVTRIGNRAFFKRQDAGADLGRLIVRELDTGVERVLVDPNKLTQDGHHVSIDQFQPSQDGRYVAVGLSPAGSEEDVLRVVDADTGQMLPDSIDRARFASPSWLPDGSSFFYNRLRAPGPHEAPSERFSNNKVFLHHLGGDPDQDVAVFGPAVGDLKTILPTDFVAVAALTGTRYALGIQSDGVSPEFGVYIAKLPDHGDTGFSWTKLADASDGIVDLSAGRDMLYMRSHQDAPRYKVIAVALDKPDLKSAKTILPGGDAVITNIAAAADGLYVVSRAGAASSVQRIGADGKSVALKLPLIGSIAPPEEGSGDLVADPRFPGAWMGIATWVTPTVWFTTPGGDAPTVADLGLAPANTAPDDYVVTETTITARDNKTKLPLSIIEKKGTPHDHKQKVLVEGYGAYGISEEPFARFVPVARGWVDAGGVLAVAHVRGGGELGDDWHLAGKKATKQNTIHDFMDTAGAMIKLGYASNATLAGMGTSAGGITTGGAITQNPTLFRAALVRVGVSDALREENTEGGPANIPEFGTVKNKTDFDALLAMDAYQHVKPNAPYPAVLLTAGAQDHRVPLWEGAKMAARLQAAGSKTRGPILLRVDYEGGHGTIGAGQKQANAEWADGFAFLLWQLGAGEFQPK
jgi:prolyl oligopeptidase